MKNRAAAMDDEVRRGVARRLSPWMSDLSGDQQAYENHVMRVLLLCDRLHEQTNSTDDWPTRRPEYLTAAAFHDLGIWTARTFDYLAPSVELARAWLTSQGEAHLEPLVIAMIEQHHKIRQADAATSPVEVFRRADTIDVTLGLRRFGLSIHEYRQTARRYPTAGFHRCLITLAYARLRTNPTSPLPMVKW